MSITCGMVHMDTDTTTPRFLTKDFPNIVVKNLKYNILVSGAQKESLSN